MKKHKLPKLLVKHLDGALDLFDNKILDILKAHEKQADLWNKAELSISDVAGHLRRKYGLDVQ